MELYQLKSFAVLAEEGSLRPAAERLFVSQPTLSGHIKALEEEFGFELFERTRRGMLLTPEGERFLERASSILAEAQKAQSLVSELRDEVSGVLRVGLINDGLELKIDDAVVALQRYPKLKIEFLHANSGANIKALRDGSLDIGYIEGERGSPDIEKITLTHSHPVIIFPRTWPDLETSDWAALEQRPCCFVSEDCSYHQLVKHEFDQRGLKLNWKYKIESGKTACQLVEQELAFAMVDRLIYQNHVDHERVAVWNGFLPTETLSLAYMKHRGNEKLVQVYRQAVMQTFSLEQTA